MALQNVHVPEPRNPLDNLVKMMNIAQSAFGIKTDFEVSKIRKEQARMEKIKADEMQAKHERRATGYMDQEELNAEMPAPPAAKGATWTRIKRQVVDEEGNRLRNPDGTIKTEDVVMWYYPKGYAEGKDKENKWANDELEINEKLALSKGRITPAMLLDDKIIYDYKWDRTEGYRPYLYTDSSGLDKPVWIKSPADAALDKRTADEERQKKIDEINAKNIEADNARAKEASDRAAEEALEAKKQRRITNLQHGMTPAEADRQEELYNTQAANRTILDKGIQVSGDVTKLQPTRPREGVPLVLAEEFLEGQNRMPKNLTAAQRAGWNNAVKAGIKNPTSEQMVIYDPAKIEKDRKEIAKKIDDSKINLMIQPLENVSKLIGGIDSTTTVPGTDDPRTWFGRLLPEGGQSRVLKPEEAKVFQEISNLRNVLQKIDAGTAVSVGEAKRTADALGTGAFATSSSLRTGLKMARNLIKNALRNIESGYAEPSRKAYLQYEGIYHSGLPILQPQVVEQPKEPEAPIAPKEAPPRPATGATKKLEGKDAIIRDLGPSMKAQPKPAATAQPQPQPQPKPATTKGAKPYTKGATQEEIDAELKRLDTLFKQ